MTTGFYNLVQFNTPTTGTGTITIGTAAPAKRTPAQAGVVDGTTVSYSIVDGSNYEYGRGVTGAGGTTMSRTVLGSSNAGAVISLSGNAKVAFTQLAEDIGYLRAQRAVTTSPIVVVANDEIINCNVSVAASCALPAAATRGGRPLTFKDWGQAAAHNITLTPNGTEKIDGQSSYVLANNYQAVTLVPANDGVNAGWMMI